MSDLARSCAAVREAAGLFALPARAVIRVSGGERTRWLDGMITNDVEALEKRGPGAGCRALLLTHQGRIVADLYVLRLEEAYLLELSAGALEAVLGHIERYIIADDVEISDESDATARLALEGPRSAQVLAEAVGAPAEIPDGGWAAVEIAGAKLWAAAFSWTRQPAVQLLVPAGAAAAVTAALREAGTPLGLIDGDAETLECLRIEAGEPAMGREIDESVLPAELGLDAAISETKGCYTGQEVVARMRSRGRANHRLVGLRFEGALPAAGTELRHEGRAAGELTSVVQSPSEGAIGLGYVKAALAEPGTRLEVDGAAAAVAERPFVS